MWTFIRLICWPLCPILLAGYAAKLVALLSEAPDNPRLQLALAGLAAGIVLYYMARTILSFLSVLHHETTHLALAFLFFRRPRAFVVKEREGFVTFTGNDDNFLIYLGPYFIPIAALLWLPAGMIFRPESLEIYVGVLGFLTGYGLGQSVGDFRPDQPDICHVGLSFSILFCTAAGVLLVGFILAVAASGFDGGIYFLQDGLQIGYNGLSQVCALLHQFLNQIHERVWVP